MHVAMCIEIYISHIDLHIVVLVQSKNFIISKIYQKPKLVEIILIESPPQHNQARLQSILIKYYKVCHYYLFLRYLAHIMSLALTVITYHHRNYQQAELMKNRIQIPWLLLQQPIILPSQILKLLCSTPSSPSTILLLSLLLANRLSYLVIISLLL